MEHGHVVCKPTSWGISRAALMGVVLIGLGIYFFYDGFVGYPQKNLEYFTHKAFEDSAKSFDEQAKERGFNSIEWSDYVSKSKIQFPSDYPIPEGVNRDGTPWPSILADYTAFTTPGVGWSSLWKKYSSELQYDFSPVETPYDHGKIFEQKVAGIITCLLGLGCFGIIFLIVSRKIEINGDAVTTGGKKFQVSDIVSIDMRQWKNKGLAKIRLSDAMGGKTARVDGLSYGGFDKNKADCNASAFMDALLARYSGEIVDYATTSDDSDVQKTDSN